MNTHLKKELLHLLLTDKSSFSKLRPHIPESLFDGDPELLLLYEVCADIHTTGTPSIGTVLNILEDRISTNKKYALQFDNGDVKELVELIYNVSYDRDTLMTMIMEEIERAKVIDAINEVATQLDAGEKVPAAVISEKFGAIGSSARSMSFSAVKNIYDVTPEELETLFMNSNNPDSYIKTGFPLLDSSIQGLSRVGEIGVVVAPPNRGKTAILISMARKMADYGYNVLFVTLETHVDDLRKRVWAANTNTAIDSLHTATREQIKFVLTGKRRIGGGIFFESYVDDPNFTPDDLSTLVEKYSETPGKRPDVIILDYIDLLLPSGRQSKNDSYRLQISNIYKAVRRVTVRHSIPLWTASQTNREGSEILLITERVIGEDFQKVAHADKIISYNQTPSEVDSKYARFFIMKTRNSAGKNKVIQLRTYFDKMRFQEVKELSFREHGDLLEELRRENNRHLVEENVQSPKKRNLVGGGLF